jgi:hypothetical protein
MNIFTLPAEPIFKITLKNFFYNNWFVLQSGYSYQIHKKNIVKLNEDISVDECGSGVK